MALYRVTSDELYHHGIIGQKWGVRRYQNEDGTLTEEGKARYNRLADISISPKQNQDLSNAKKAKGIINVSKDLDIIKKGQIIRRIADPNEPIDDRRKYVSILDNDSMFYLNFANEGLGNEIGGNPVQYEYSLKKDIKVAPAEMVSRYILNKNSDLTPRNYEQRLRNSRSESTVNFILKNYGDVPIKNLYNDRDISIQMTNGIWDINKKNKNEDRVDRLLKERVFASTTVTNYMFRDDLLKNGEDVLKYFKSLGYDAIVDVEDRSPGHSDYPLIILNPSETLKFDNVSSTNDAYKNLWNSRNKNNL